MNKGLLALRRRFAALQHRTTLIAVAGALLAGGFVAGYRAHVLAEGAPTDQPLFYSGTLEVDGMPASGEYTVIMTLHDAATAGNELCGTEAKTMVDAGRFRIDASDCAEAVAAEPDAWVAVRFEGSDGVEHAIPERAKIGAVPYAMEAQHAVSASSPSGALATTIQQLTERVNALEAVGSATRSSAFLAYKTTPQTIPDDPPNSSPRIVIFDNEVVDANSEYNNATGRFTAKTAGLYEFTCTLAWSANANSNGTWEAALELNAFEHVYSGHFGDGVALTKTVTAVMQLKVDDDVTCTGLTTQAGGTPLNINSGSTYNTFAGHRIR